MEAATAGEPRRFDHLRERSIGLPQVLFQSITHMAPAAAVAYSIYILVPDAQQALLEDMERVYVEDATVAPPEAQPAFLPEA
jgi:hypothetical protein